jgi:hypothetical protein
MSQAALRTWRFAAAAIACAAGFVTVPATSLAGSCAPPGNSGVDQYFETVPGSGCNQGSGGGGRHHGHGGSLPPGTSGTLGGQGPVGRAVQQLVVTSGTNPPAQQGSSGGGGSNGQGSGPQGPTGNNPSSPGKPTVPAAHGNVPTAGGRGLLSALMHPIVSGSASGGTGILLPLFLAAVLVLAVAALMVRRRRFSSGS